MLVWDPVSHCVSPVSRLRGIVYDGHVAGSLMFNIVFPICVLSSLTWKSDQDHEGHAFLAAMDARPPCKLGSLE